MDCQLVGREGEANPVHVSNPAGARSTNRSRVSHMLKVM